MLKRSSLYEKPGKNPHAFCIDIDRAGDVRVLENVVPGREWLTTSLHELGHAVYSEECRGAGAAERGTGALCRSTRRAVPAKRLSPFPQPLPYVLHTDAHPLCTEGVAMMFQRFADNVDWLEAMGAKVSEPEQVSAGGGQVAAEPIAGLFPLLPGDVPLRDGAVRRLRQKGGQARICAKHPKGRPGKCGTVPLSAEQDLNRLWWDLVEKYQEIKRPEGRNQPDYASKYHLIGAPAYYHNYMLGEMFASQVHHALVRTVLPGIKPAGAIYVGNKAAGQFMKRQVFEPGLTLKWDDLTRHATGEPLNPKAFAEDIEAAR